MDERLKDIEITYHHEEQYTDGWSDANEEQKDVYAGISVYVDIKLGLSDLWCDEISEIDLTATGEDSEGEIKGVIEGFIVKNVKEGLIETKDKDFWIEAICKQIFNDLDDDYREYLRTFRKYGWL